jgi:sugar phosphate isomerase/epimerase
MKLGVSTYAFTWSIGFAGQFPAIPMNASAFLRKAAEMGSRLVQIADNIPLDKFSFSERRQLCRLAEELGVQVEVGMRGLMEENVLKYLEIAQEFRSPILRIVCDTDTFKPDAGEVVEIVRSLTGSLEAAQVVLAIENHDRFDAATLVSIIRTVASPWVGICLDTVNSFGALVSPEVVIETLGPLAVNLHLKDFTVKRASHSMGFVVEGAPAGEGRLNILYLLDRLKAFGRDPNVILETWVTPEARLENSIIKEQEWTARGFARLRQLISE